jgi:hypothetical protein
MALSTRSTTRPTIGAARARQGRLGRSILWVLLISMLLVVLGFFATWTWKAPDLARVAPNTATERADVRDFTASQPAAAARQNNGDPGQPNRSDARQP